MKNVISLQPLIKMINQMTLETDTDSQQDQTNRRKKRLSRRSMLSGIGVVGIGALAGCLGSTNTDAEFEADGDDEQYREEAATFLTSGTLYKTHGCECCLEHKSYLEDATDAEIEVVETDDLTEIKDGYNVPSDVESCHTLDAGEYFIEGHVPQEAIGKLSVGEFDVAGIALPEMPHSD